MRSILIILASVCYFNLSFGQSASSLFPVDPLTKRITIDDSIMVGPDYSIDSVKVLIEKWSNYMGDRKNAGRMFGYTIYQQATLIYTPIYSYDFKPGCYKDIQIYYDSVGQDGKTDTSNKLLGSVRFRLDFKIKGNYLMLSYTEMSFTSRRNEMGQLEDAALLSSDGVHFLTNEQMPWPKIKQEYFERVRILSQNLNHFLTTHYQTPNQPIYLKERW